jgi:hypothetical protein
MLGCRQFRTGKRLDDVTSIWRYLGSLPSGTAGREHGVSAEELRARMIEGWAPHEHLNWRQLNLAPLVVPNPQDPSRVFYARIFEVPFRGDVRRFATDVADDGSEHYWLPALGSEAGAFAASALSYEGHWSLPNVPGDDRPWPVSDPTWSGLSAFLPLLDRAEGKAERIAYRGKSYCRLCDQINGHVAYRLNQWEWPEGYRHYLTDHAVRPTREFEAFLRLMGTCG